ncbi:methyltransferase domain-containing protein [Lipomyces arxii]|uniref:methyltransferase domain-containing protein n=1 Tax=Lipomyces arxii TaxID=56418 RepID=UPI0034D01A7D
MTEEVEKLNSSKLGTKQYWDDFYAVEQKNFSDNSEDEGEVWFSDADAEDKVVKFLIDHTASSAEYVSDEFPFLKDSTTVIDLGTGNGHLVFRVRSEAEFRAELVGIDYSETSVQFANRILQKKKECEEIEDPKNNVKFNHVDFLSTGYTHTGEAFDLVLDKGTLDAIALSGDSLCDGQTGVQLYPAVVRDNFVKHGGIILITSCNFTEDELIKLMDIEGLEVWKTINYPVYEFGGMKGQSISSVAFRRSR